ncbi:MAG: molybdenum cofactor guanylyltransferase [Bacteroidetes bacterium]|nr:molybdenum cofactor guanylyltransferase [Bacteroidota bacterium]
MYNDITGIILSGGKSSRMGENKSFLKIQDETIIERIVKLMGSIFDEVMIITNSPDEYKFLGLPLNEDIYKNKGPLGGIHAGLSKSKTERNFIISCDMPLMTNGMIEYLTEYPTKKLITIAKADGFVQLLCGVYSKKCLPLIEMIFKDFEEETRDTDQKQRSCNVDKLTKMIDAEILDVEKRFTNYIPGTFFNMNNQKEYILIKDKYIKQNF